MNVVGMVSAYKEGRLVRGAIRSLLRVGLDALYVYEGPAGEPLGDEVPDSELDDVQGYASLLMPHTQETRASRLVFRENRWRTDARKRNEMLQRAKADFPGPGWAVVVDADEVLVHGEYLRDRLELIMAEDDYANEQNATRDVPPSAPTARWPLRLVEADGSLSLITARVFRLDLVQTIDHSSSVITNSAGIVEGWGNYEEASRLWLEAWLRATDEGKLIAWPPLPCEPHLVHRANLRHPLRRGLRMSVQEREEFARARAAELGR